MLPDSKLLWHHVGEKCGAILFFTTSAPWMASAASCQWANQQAFSSVCVCLQMAADSCNPTNTLRIFLRVCISSLWLLLQCGCLIGLPQQFSGEQSACHAGDSGLISVLGRSCGGGGHDNPFQYSLLENPSGQRSMVGYCPSGCKESNMTEATNRNCFLTFLKPENPKSRCQ